MANVKVAVRVRPLSKREEENDAVSVVNVHNETLLSITNWKIGGTDEGDRHRERVKYFSFDYVFNSSDIWDENYASQEKVYQQLGPEVISAACDGYNTCLFAYGQTSSGKTHTMVGTQVDCGLIPRISEGLFKSVTHLNEDVTYKFEISFLEIYNEKVRDLLAPLGNTKFALKVREHAKDGPYVPDLSRHIVSDHQQVVRLLEQGMISRTTASTHMHEFSSRSHAIFTIHFVQAKMEHQLPSEIVSKINLVDLAGSERANLNFSKDRLQEGANINKSLVMLGNCISALAENALSAISMESLANDDTDLRSSQGFMSRSAGFVPYRNSVLTWLLKDSLGGNAKTVMIATVSPASIHYNETMSTLRYARRATHIVNQPVINEDPHVKLIRELRGEIHRLKNLLCSASLGSSSASLCQDYSINQMLQENEVRVDQLTEAWVDKWKDVALIMQECNVGIRRQSVGVVVESDLPHLIGLNDDLSSGIVLYHIQNGCTRIGRDDAITTQDIVLNSTVDVEREHAVITNEDGVVTFYPLGDAACTINGVDVHEPVQLKQGAVILLGKTNMFRFNHPAQAARMREKRAIDRYDVSTLFQHGSVALAAASQGESSPVESSTDGTQSPDDTDAVMEQMSLLLSPRSPHDFEEGHFFDSNEFDSFGEEEVVDSEECIMGDNQQELVERQRLVVCGLKKEHALAMAKAEEELEEMERKVEEEKDKGALKLQQEIENYHQHRQKASSSSELADESVLPKFVDLESNQVKLENVECKQLMQRELILRHSERKAVANLGRKRAAIDVQRMSTELEIEEEEKRLHEMEMLVSYTPPSERLSSLSSDASSNGVEENKNSKAKNMSKASAKPNSNGKLKDAPPRRENGKITLSEKHRRSSSLSQKEKTKKVLPNRTRSRSASVSSTKSSDSRTGDGKLLSNGNSRSSSNVFSRLYPQNTPKFEYLKKKDPIQYEDLSAKKSSQWERGKLIRREVSPLKGETPPGKSNIERQKLKHSYQPKSYENELSVIPKKPKHGALKHSGTSSTLPRTKSPSSPCLSRTMPGPKKEINSRKKGNTQPKGKGKMKPFVVSNTSSLPDVSSVNVGKARPRDKMQSTPDLPKKILKKGEKKAPVWQDVKDSPQRLKPELTRLRSGSDLSTLSSTSSFPKETSGRRKCSIGLWTSVDLLPIQKSSSQAYFLPWNSEKCVSLENLTSDMIPQNMDCKPRSSSMIDLPINAQDDTNNDIPVGRGKVERGDRQPETLVMESAEPCEETEEGLPLFEFPDNHEQDRDESAKGKTCYETSSSSDISDIDSLEEEIEDEDQFNEDVCLNKEDDAAEKVEEQDDQVNLQNGDDSLQAEQSTERFSDSVEELSSSKPSERQSDGVMEENIDGDETPTPLSLGGSKMMSEVESQESTNGVSVNGSIPDKSPTESNSKTCPVSPIEERETDTESSSDDLSSCDESVASDATYSLPASESLLSKGMDGEDFSNKIPVICVKEELPHGKDGDAVMDQDQGVENGEMETVDDDSDSAIGHCGVERNSIHREAGCQTCPVDGMAPHDSNAQESSSDDFSLFGDSASPDAMSSPPKLGLLTEENDPESLGRNGSIPVLVSESVDEQQKTFCETGCQTVLVNDEKGMNDLGFLKSKDVLSSDLIDLKVVSLPGECERKEEGDETLQKVLVKNGDEKRLLTEVSCQTYPQDSLGSHGTHGGQSPCEDPVSMNGEVYGDDTKPNTLKTNKEVPGASESKEEGDETLQKVLVKNGDEKTSLTEASCQTYPQDSLGSNGTHGAQSPCEDPVSLNGEVYGDDTKPSTLKFNIEVSGESARKEEDDETLKEELVKYGDEKRLTEASCQTYPQGSLGSYGTHGAQSPCEDPVSMNGGGVYSDDTKPSTRESNKEAPAESSGYIIPHEMSNHPSLNGESRTVSEVACQTYPLDCVELDGAEKSDPSDMKGALFPTDWKSCTPDAKEGIKLDEMMPHENGKMPDLREIHCQTLPFGSLPLNGLDGKEPLKDVNHELGDSNEVDLENDKNVVEQDMVTSSNGLPSISGGFSSSTDDENEEDETQEKEKVTNDINQSGFDGDIPPKVAVTPKKTGIDGDCFESDFKPDKGADGFKGDEAMTGDSDDSRQPNGCPERPESITKAEILQNCNFVPHKDEYGNVSPASPRSSSDLSSSITDHYSSDGNEEDTNSSPSPLDVPDAIPELYFTNTPTSPKDDEMGREEEESDHLLQDGANYLEEDAYPIFDSEDDFKQPDIHLKGGLSCNMTDSDRKLDSTPNDSNSSDGEMDRLHGILDSSDDKEEDIIVAKPEGNLGSDDRLEQSEDSDISVDSLHSLTYSPEEVLKVPGEISERPKEALNSSSSASLHDGVENTELKPSEPVSQSVPIEEENEEDNGPFNSEIEGSIHSNRKRGKNVTFGSPLVTVCDDDVGSQSETDQLEMRDLGEEDCHREIGFDEDGSDDKYFQNNSKDNPVMENSEVNPDETVVDGWESSVLGMEKEDWEMWGDVESNDETPETSMKVKSDLAMDSDLSGDEDSEKMEDGGNVMQGEEAKPDEGDGPFDGADYGYHDLQGRGDPFEETEDVVAVAVDDSFTDGENDIVDFEKGTVCQKCQRRKVDEDELGSAVEDTGEWCSECGYRKGGQENGKYGCSPEADGVNRPSDVSQTANECNQSSVENSSDNFPDSLQDRCLDGDKALMEFENDSNPLKGFAVGINGIDGYNKNNEDTSNKDASFSDYDETEDEDEAESSAESEEFDVDSFKRNVMQVGVVFNQGKRYIMDGDEIFDPFALSPIKEERDNSEPASPLLIAKDDFQLPLSEEEGDVALYQRGEMEKVEDEIMEPGFYSDESDEDGMWHEKELPDDEMTDKKEEWFPPRVEVALIKDVFTAEQDLPIDLIKSPDLENFLSQQEDSFDRDVTFGELAPHHSLPLHESGGADTSKGKTESLLPLKVSTSPTTPVDRHCGISPATNYRKLPKISFSPQEAPFLMASPCSSPESPQRKFIRGNHLRDSGSDTDVSDGETTATVRGDGDVRARANKMYESVSSDTRRDFVRASRAKLSKFVQFQENKEILVHQMYSEEEETQTESDVLVESMIQSWLNDPQQGRDSSEEENEADHQKVKKSSHKTACPSSFTTNVLSSKRLPSRKDTARIKPVVTNYTQTSPTVSPGGMTTPKVSIQRPSKLHLHPKEGITVNRNVSRGKKPSHNQSPSNNFRWDLFPPATTFQPPRLSRSQSLPTKFDNPLLVSPRKGSADSPSSDGGSRDFGLNMPSQEEGSGDDAPTDPFNDFMKSLEQSRQLSINTSDQVRELCNALWRSTIPEMESSPSLLMESKVNGKVLVGDEEDSITSKELQGTRVMQREREVDENIHQFDSGWRQSSLGTICARCHNSIHNSAGAENEEYTLRGGDDASELPLVNEAKVQQHPLTGDTMGLISPVWELLCKEAVSITSQEDFFSRVNALLRKPQNEQNHEQVPSEGKHTTQPLINVTSSSGSDEDDLKELANKLTKSQSRMRPVSQDVEELVPQRVQMPAFSDVSFDSEFAEHEFFSDDEKDGSVNKKGGEMDNVEDEDEDGEGMAERGKVGEDNDVDPDLWDDVIEPELTALMSNSTNTPVNQPSEHSVSIDAQTKTKFSPLKGDVGRPETLLGLGNFATDIPAHRIKDHSNDYVLSVNINIPPFPHRVEQRWNPPSYDANLQCNWSDAPERGNASNVSRGSEMLNKNVQDDAWMSHLTDPNTHRVQGVANGPKRFPSESTESQLTASSGVFTSSIQTNEAISSPNKLNESLSSTDSVLAEDEDMVNVQNELQHFLAQDLTGKEMAPTFYEGCERVQTSTPEGIGTQVDSSELDRSWTSPDLDSLRSEREMVRRLSNSWDRSDLAVELMEARIMHGIGETDAFLRFLDNDIPLEEWLRTKTDLDMKHDEEKKEILALEKHDAVKVAPSGEVARPPSFQCKGWSPKKRKPPSEHLKFLQGLRKDLVTNIPPSFADTKNEIEALLQEYKELHRNSESEIAQAQKSLDGVRGVTRTPVAEQGPEVNAGRSKESDSDEDLIDKEIQSLHAASIAMSISDSPGSDASSHRRFDFSSVSSDDDYITADTVRQRGQYARLNGDLSEPLKLVKTPTKKSLKEKLEEAERQVSSERQLRRKSEEQCRQSLMQSPGEWSESECSVLIGQTFQLLLQETASFQGVQQHSVEERWEFRGWRVLSEMKGTFIFEKCTMDSSPKRYLGFETIKAPASCVFNHLRKPFNLQGVFGKCLKKLSVLQRQERGEIILQLIFNTRQCGLHYPRAVTCIFLAEKVKNKFVVGATSVKQCKLQTQKTVPAIVLHFGFCVDSFYSDGMEHCRVAVISQIDLKDCLEADMLQIISQKLLSKVLRNLKGLVEVGHL